MTSCDPPLLGYDTPGSTDGCGVVFATSGWCDSAGTPVDVHYVRDCDTLALTVLFVDPSTGAPATPTLPLRACGGGGTTDFEQLAICDIDPSNGQVLGVYLVRTIWDGTTVTTQTVSIDTGLPYTPGGVPRFCGEGMHTEAVEMCAEDSSFPGVIFPVVVHYQYLAGGAILGVYATLPDSVAPISGWGTTVTPRSCAQTPIQYCPDGEPALAVRVACAANPALRNDVYEVPALGGLSLPVAGTLASVTITAPSGVTVTTLTSGPVTFPAGTYTFDSEFGRSLGASPGTIVIAAPAGGSVWVQAQEIV